MSLVAFGTARKRREGRWLLAGMLLATMALVMAPGVEAAGGVTDHRGPEILGMSADGSLYISNFYNAFYDAYDGHVARATGGHFDMRLPRLGGDTDHNFAQAINGPGTAIVGYGRTAEGYNRAWLMRADYGTILHYNQIEVVPLGTLFPANDAAQSYASGVSGDGTRVVGRSTRLG